MLRNITYTTLGLLLVLYIDSASAADATATASATILQPIAVSTTTHLSFGDIYPDKTAAGTVTVDVDGGRSAGGSAKLGATAGTAALFAVTGESNTGFSVSLPSSIDITHDDGITTMAVNSFNHNATAALDANGAANFNVGATLQVGADQKPGAYTGSFNVTVNYN